MKKQNVIMLITLITGILLVTTGITYSLFTSSKTSKNSSLVVGDVYMNYNETNELTIENAMPSDNYDKTKYFEFTVTGKNTTTNKDIWYEIVLNHGNNHETRTERIKDSLLKFRLTSVNNGVETEIFTNKSYSSLLNKRIYVDTINKNTTSEITKTYRLYMWVSNSTKIGNTSNSTYDITTWNNQVYGSIKVNVSGDFNEKTLATDEACFTVGTINDGNEVAILDYDEICGTDVIIPSTIKGYPVTVIGNSGTNVIEQLSNKTNNYNFNDLNNYPNSYYEIQKVAPTPSSIGSFWGKGIKSVEIPDGVVTIDTSAFEHNQLTSVTIPNSVTTIGTSAFNDNCLTSIIIGNGIQYIGGNTFTKSTSSNSNLSKITIDKNCSDIKNIPVSSTDTYKYYPWLDWNSPYTASGVTIYGTDGVCDSY